MAWDRELAARVVEPWRDREGPLLPMLHAIQDAFGHVPDEAVPFLADLLNLSRAEVHGVVSFYHDFRRAPAGRHVVKLCCAEACQAMGCRQLRAELEAGFGIALGETTPDGRVTLEAVYCLGNCALSPAALIDGKLHGRLDAARVRALVG